MLPGLFGLISRKMQRPLKLLPESLREPQRRLNAALSPWSCLACASVREELQSRMVQRRAHASQDLPVYFLLRTMGDRAVLLDRHDALLEISTVGFRLDALPLGLRRRPRKDAADYE